MRYPTLGFISGYAALFHKPDSGGDIVLPGAFAASLRRRPARYISMLGGHKWHTPPTGGWMFALEDEVGLLVIGRLRRGGLRLVRRGWRGLSIGFHVRESRLCRETGKRYLSAIDLLEISIVKSPQQPAALARNVIDLGRPNASS